jgi:hypothetical protein
LIQNLAANHSDGHPQQTTRCNGAEKSSGEFDMGASSNWSRGHTDKTTWFPKPVRILERLVPWLDNQGLWNIWSCLDWQMEPLRRWEAVGLYQ